MNSKKVIRQKSALRRFTILPKHLWFAESNTGLSFLHQGFELEHPRVCARYDEYIDRKKEELKSLEASIARR